MVCDGDGDDDDGDGGQELGDWLVLLLGCAFAGRSFLVRLLGMAPAHQTKEGPVDLYEFQRHHRSTTNNSICILIFQSLTSFYVTVIRRFALRDARV